MKTAHLEVGSEAAFVYVLYGDLMKPVSKRRAT
jgi:hypothetical protein